MNCTRCNIPHMSTNQLITTERGLLCPGCARVLEATLVIRGDLGTMLFDENGHVMDPTYNPYTEMLGERTEAQKRIGAILDKAVKEIIAKLTAVETEEMNG